MKSLLKIVILNQEEKENNSIVIKFTVTIRQLIRFGRSPKRVKLNNKKTNYKRQCLISGTCIKKMTLNPKKPNSAMRKCAKVRLSNGVEVNCHVPGEGVKFEVNAKMYLRPCRLQDVPGVSFTVLTGRGDVGLPVGRYPSGSPRKKGRSKYCQKGPSL